MNGPDHQSCDGCRWYTQNTEYDWFGECFRFPPSLLASGHFQISKQPHVRSAGWCGEWKDENEEL